MEDKTRKLIIALELVALVTAGILILIDYKLKQDLLKLFERIESAIETGNRLYSQDPDFSADTSRVPRGSMVGDNPPMETSASATAHRANGSGKPRASRGKATDSSRGTRDTPIQESSESVGP
jgi:hypothetical protein